MPTNTLFMTGLLCVWYAISATANPRYRNQWGRSVISSRDLRPLAAIPLDAIFPSLHRPLRGIPRCAPWHREARTDTLPDSCFFQVVFGGDSYAGRGPSFSPPPHSATRSSDVYGGSSCCPRSSPGMFRGVSGRFSSGGGVGVVRGTM